MRRPFPNVLLAAGLAMSVLLFAMPSVDAKMDGKEWKETEALFKDLFSKRGNPKGKAAVLAQVVSDGTGRAWRTIAQGLVDEVKLWAGIREEYAEVAGEHGALLQQAGTDGYTAVEENKAQELQERLQQLEEETKAESEVLQAVVKAIAEAPEALRKIILSRAKGGDDWPFRAAAIRLAVATKTEKNSLAFLSKALVGDKDPRVRIAGLDALADAADGWEALVLGRLGDRDWGVVLRAVQILEARDAKKAVPHLINAMASASPRMAEAISNALKTLTGENFEAYHDIWEKWWAEHKRDFEGDVAVKKSRPKDFAAVHFYGVPIKSDRVLFIIDISGSMKLKTENKNPGENWKPPPTVTGGRAPPPPPPPEQILSGPKIDVAKHELKKTIQKLPEDWSFNIISFNTGMKRWRPGMVKAKKKDKEEALKWVRALKPSGSTYIDGALKEAFTIAGLINFDSKYPTIAVDTIILLSDGAPTDNSFPHSKLMEPKVILDHVRLWNQDKKVVIHTISVDMVKGVEFMKKLSAENGGTHTDR